MKRKGIFVVADGLDAAGKGVIVSALAEYEQSKGKKVFDLIRYWKEHERHPDYDLLNAHDVIISAEPTYAGVGLSIREYLIAKGTSYPAMTTAQAYAIDRFILLKDLLLPALDNGKIIFQERSVSSSLAYQKLQAEESGEALTMGDIAKIEGNRFALDNFADLFIIPTIKNVGELTERLKSRDKIDDCRFENLGFQLKLKPIFESSDYLKYFDSKIEFLDVGVSVTHTKNEAVRIWKEFLQNRD